MIRMIVVGLLVCLALERPALGQANSGTGATNIRLDQGTEQLEKEGDAIATSFTNQVQALSKVGEPTQASDTGTSPWFYVAIGLVVIFVLRKLLPMVSVRQADSPRDRSRETVAVPAGVSDATGANLHAETFQTPSWPQGTTEKEASAVETEAAEEFFRGVSQDLASLRKSLCELGRLSAPDDQKWLVNQLLNEVRSLQNKSNISVVRPLWQLAGGVESLLNQLTDENEELKPSTLRTLASAIDLLHSLSVRGIRTDLAAHPAPRLLAVDDDPVSRFAVAAAMKRYLVKPETATEGEAALGLAEETAYDLIFLDVQMPGMDGFELCSRIHATAPNRTTPIVFVTCQSDFDARAKSSLMGGQDLIGKPFMAAELSLKALTLVLRRRLQAEGAPRPARRSSTTPPSTAQHKEGNCNATEPQAIAEPAFAASAVAPA